MAPITLTIKQATVFTGLSQATIYALIREGRLSKTKIGRRTLLQRSELVDLVTPNPARQIKYGDNVYSGASS
jgi:excisionase family DNA binding protein